MSTLRLAVFVALALVPSGAGAAVLTVGPAGRYATVQPAFDVAVGLTGTVEIRLQVGTFYESVDVARCCSGRVLMSGGWNARFDVQEPSPKLTVLDAAGTGRVLAIHELPSGLLRISNLTLRNGRYVGGPADSAVRGGGLYALVVGTGELHVKDAQLLDNVLENYGTGKRVLGGAAQVSVRDDGKVAFENCDVRGNVATAGGDATLAWGGGLSVWLSGRGQLQIRRSHLQDNVAKAAAPFGGGLYVTVSEDVQALIEGNGFHGNGVTATVRTGAGAGASLDVWRGRLSVPQLVFRRNTLLHNDAGTPASQLHLHTQDQGRLLASDSVVAGGGGDGVLAEGLPTTYISMNNLTVVDQAGAGIYASGASAKVSVFNTITFGNGGADLTLHGDAFGGFNLAGVDPWFVDRAAGNYRLLPGSPAQDAGTLRPPGGLGAFDRDGRPRVAGAGVDIGAYEIP